jgi:hypothetical protein
MDRRKLIFCFCMSLGLSNIHAQQGQTPASTPVSRPQLEVCSRDLAERSETARGAFDWRTPAKKVHRRNSRTSVEHDVDSNPRQMAQLIRVSDGLAESPQQHSSIPHDGAELIRTCTATVQDTPVDEADHRLDIAGPLSRVSLSLAARPESVTGAALKEPEDEALTTFSAAGVIHEHSFARQFRPNRNRHPVWYKPLYFEDPNLERCGTGAGIFNEAVSAIRFFGRVPALPSMMATRPPHQCVRALPDCPTCHKFGHDAYLTVPEPDAALLEIAAAVGLIFLIP